MSDHMLHPELFEGVFLGKKIAEHINARAAFIASEETATKDPSISVVVRTRNDAQNLLQLAAELDLQDYTGEVELVLVDTESSDGTPEVLSDLPVDTTLVPVTQAEFTYPLALNRGLEAAAYENVFVTVGHANFSNTQTLKAIAKNLRTPNIVGAWGSALPGASASKTERLFGSMVLRDLSGGTREIASPPKGFLQSLGILQATGAAIARSAWQEFGGFSPRYESGGEDTDLGIRMLHGGNHLAYDPALSVHHSHGLGPINSLRQMAHWYRILQGPSQFDAVALAKRRPDLDIN